MAVMIITRIGKYQCRLSAGITGYERSQQQELKQAHERCRKIEVKAGKSTAQIRDLL